MMRIEISTNPTDKQRNSSHPARSTLWRCATVMALALAANATAILSPALAQNRTDKVIKIGVLNDQSSLYADNAGPGSVVAARMAVEDSGLLAKGWKIDVIAGDHQNKPDIGVSIARQWVDVEKVDVFVDGSNSGVALAVANIVDEKNVVDLNSGAAVSDLTGPACHPTTIQWSYDSYMLSRGTASALTKEGNDTWFFVTVDYTYGASLERDATDVVKANGGKVLGSVKHPLNSTDLASYLLQAQASRAKVIALANGGSDTTNAIKQAGEFGIVAGGQKLAGMLIFINYIPALGLDKAQGLYLTSSYYWDMNDGTRAFSKRFLERHKKTMPTMVHAGVYSSLLHYFKTLEALGGNPHDGRAIVAKMKEMPTDDPLFGKGRILANGRKVHPAYLFQVKTPSESKYPWDFYKLVSTIPAEKAFAPAEKSGCPLMTSK